MSRVEISGRASQLRQQRQLLEKNGSFEDNLDLADKYDQGAELIETFEKKKLELQASKFYTEAGVQDELRRVHVPKLLKAATDFEAEAMKADEQGAKAGDDAIEHYLRRPAGLTPEVDDRQVRDRQATLRSGDPADVVVFLKNAAEQGTHQAWVRAALLIEEPPWATGSAGSTARRFSHLTASDRRAIEQNIRARAGTLGAWEFRAIELRGLANYLRQTVEINPLADLAELEAHITRQLADRV